MEVSEAKEECCEGEMPQGMGSRVALSIIVFFGKTRNKAKAVNIKIKPV